MTYEPAKQTAQQHIQARVIDKVRQLLATTNLQVSEIAYQMGIEYPQSFHKLFKNKTACLRYNTVKA